MYACARVRVHAVKLVSKGRFWATFASREIFTEDSPVVVTRLVVRQPGTFDAVALTIRSFSGVDVNEVTRRYDRRDDSDGDARADSPPGRLRRLQLFFCAYRERILGNVRDDRREQMSWGSHEVNGTCGPEIKGEGQTGLMPAPSFLSIRTNIRLNLAKRSKRPKGPGPNGKHSRVRHIGRQSTAKRYRRSRREWRFS